MFYTYQHPKTKEIRDIQQGMNDKHQYFGNGKEKKVEWIRIFNSPEIAKDTKTDPFDSRKYVEKTGDQKGTFKDLREQSQESSEKRKSLYGGEDPLKRQYFDNWSKERNGLSHPQDNKQKTFKDVKKSIEERREKKNKKNKIMQK